MLPYYVQKLKMLKPAINMNLMPLSSTEKVDVYVEDAVEPEVVVIHHKQHIRLSELPVAARPLIAYYLTTSVLEPDWREVFEQALTAMFGEIHGMMTTWGDIYGDHYDYAMTLMETNITFYLRVEREGDGDEFSFHMAICTGTNSKELYYSVDMSEMNWLSKTPFGVKG